MVRIRCKRLGRKNRPFYRIGVFDGRVRRDGRTIEDIGTYDPMNPKQDEVYQVKADRAVFWLDRGAQPSETVASIFRKLNIKKTVGAKATASAS